MLVGPRRSGKTTLLRSMFLSSNAGKSFNYITLDDLDALSFAKADPKGFIQSLGNKVVIDEIQRASQLSIAIKKIIDENKSARFYMTGSSSIGLLDQSADTLAGRVVFKHMPTVCWGEEEGEPTHSFFQDKLTPPQIAEARRKFETALLYGGFPEVVTKDNAPEKVELLKEYRDSYFTRDLAQLSNIENIDGLHAVLLHLAKSIGSHLEVSNFARESALSYLSAKKYLNVLLQSELTFKLSGYQFGPAKRLIKAAKHYYADNGIFTALRVDVSRGQLIENFVISELEKRRKLGFIDADSFFYYKTNAGAEVDLIIDEEKTFRVIGIKSTDKIAPKDIRNLLQYKSSYEGKKPLAVYLVYLGSEYQQIEGISCLPIYALHRAR